MIFSFSLTTILHQMMLFMLTRSSLLSQCKVGDDELTTPKTSFNNNNNNNNNNNKR